MGGRREGRLAILLVLLLLTAIDGAAGQALLRSCTAHAAGTLNMGVIRSTPHSRPAHQSMNRLTIALPLK